MQESLHSPLTFRHLWHGWRVVANSRIDSQSNRKLEVIILAKDNQVEDPHSYRKCLRIFNVHIIKTWIVKSFWKGTCTLICPKLNVSNTEVSRREPGHIDF